MNTVAFIKKPLSHADLRNARFNTNTSVFVSAKQRYDDYCIFVPGAATQMQHAITEFKNKFPNLKWKDIQSKLVGAQSRKLSDIRIDDTMNRPLDWDHVMKILKNFCPTRIMAVNVYEDSQLADLFVAWDGQHTTIVLYIISVLIFGEAIGNIEIPTNISKSKSKEEIRTNFIEINGDAQLDLSPLDLFEQKIYGVTVDGSNNPDWVIAAKKFELLKRVELFLTSVAYRDQDQPGAITHIDAIINSDLDVVEKFTNYWFYRRQLENRRVESKELIHMIYLFNYAKNKGVDWTDSDIKSIVDIFWNCFSCEFTGTQHLNVFWKRLDSSYNIWYDKVYKAPEPGEEDFRPKHLDMKKNGTHQETYGLAFMLKQLEFSGFKGKLPVYNHEAGYKPSKNDLWDYSIDVKS